MTRRSRPTTIMALALAGAAAFLGPGSGSVANAGVSGGGVPPSYTTFTMDCGSGPMLVAAIGSGRWDAFLVVGTTQVFAPFAHNLTIVTPGSTFTDTAAKGPVPSGAITCTRDNWFGPVHVFGTPNGTAELAPQAVHEHQDDRRGRRRRPLADSELLRLVIERNINQDRSARGYSEAGQGISSARDHRHHLGR